MPSFFSCQQTKLYGQICPESVEYVCQTFEQGALSVYRTGNSFARNPVDMTLKPTISADAASKLSGCQHSVKINYVH